MDWDSLYKYLKSLNWIVILILAALSYFFMNNAFTTGVIVGGFMVMANFHLLQHTIRQGFSPDQSKNPGKASVIVKYYLRLIAMGVLIYFFISQHWVDPIGLTVGLSTVVISIAALGIVLIRKTYSEETL